MIYNPKERGLLPMIGFLERLRAQNLILNKHMPITEKAFGACSRWGSLD
jgi:hypothetical protein